MIMLQGRAIAPLSGASKNSSGHGNSKSHSLPSWASYFNAFKVSHSCVRLDPTVLSIELSARPGCRGIGIANSIVNCDHSTPDPPLWSPIEWMLSWSSHHVLVRKSSFSLTTEVSVILLSFSAISEQVWVCQGKQILNTTCPTGLFAFTVSYL